MSKLNNKLMSIPSNPGQNCSIWVKFKADLGIIYLTKANMDGTSLVLPQSIPASLIDSLTDLRPVQYIMASKGPVYSTFQKLLSIRPYM